MLVIGTKVAIMPGADYANRFVGEIGVVTKHFKDKVGVKLANYSNPDSEYGIFWFKEQYLALVSDDIVGTVEEFINKVIFNDTKTIILWKDGTKTIVSCCEDDKYDKYVGFCVAVAKKMFGSTSKVKKIINRYIQED